MSSFYRQFPQQNIMYGVDCNNLAPNSQGYQWCLHHHRKLRDCNLSNVSLQNLSAESVKNIFVLCHGETENNYGDKKQFCGYSVSDVVSCIYLYLFHARQFPPSLPMCLARKLPGFLVQSKLRHLWRSRHQPEK